MRSRVVRVMWFRVVVARGEISGRSGHVVSGSSLETGILGSFGFGDFGSWFRDGYFRLFRARVVSDRDH